MMEPEKWELFSVLDLPEVSQKIWLVAKGILKSSKGSKGEVVLEESLAELAFRLRDDLHYAIGLLAWDKACWEVWKHERKKHQSNIFERKHLSIDQREKYCYNWMSFWAKPIHHIVTALYAKILAQEPERDDG